MEKDIYHVNITEGSMKKCPYCAEEIQDEAIYCRFCTTWLEELKTTDFKIQICPFCAEEIKVNSVICRYCDCELEVNNIERNEVSGKEPSYRPEFILGLIIGGFI